MYFGTPTDIEQGLPLVGGIIFVVCVTLVSAFRKVSIESQLLKRYFN